MSPRKLQNRLKQESRTEESVWIDYRNEIVNNFADDKYQDLSDHLLREFNRKIFNFGLSDELLFRPFDGGFRFLGDKVADFFDPDYFVLRVDTSLRTGSTTVLIPVNAHTGDERTIDWGDGSVTIENATNPTHVYAADGVYTIQMYGGTTTRLGNTLDAGWQQTLIEIIQWGKGIGWTSFQDALRSCTQNVLVPTEIPRGEDGYKSSVTNISNMFLSASAFNQDIGAWSLRTAGVDMGSMLSNSGMSTENYSRTLIGWANSVDENGETPINVTLNATGRTYNDTAYVSGQTYNDAVAARAYLTGTPPTWTITDAGQV